MAVKRNFVKRNSEKSYLHSVEFLKVSEYFEFVLCLLCYFVAFYCLEVFSLICIVNSCE